jgi:hypothetical protein
MVIDGKLDKYGKPNEVTPQDWLDTYRDFNPGGGVAAAAAAGAAAAAAGRGVGLCLVIFPLLMQLVQTRMRLGWPLTKALTACRLTFQRRLVTLCACEMLLPNCGPLPQMSHTCAIVQLQILEYLTAD